MKIGIEAQRIFRRKKHGMDMVAIELIRNLAKIKDGNQYVIFVHPDQDDQILTETDNLRISLIKGGFYPFWEQVSLARAARKAGCDVLHCTSNTAPLFSSLPLVVTLHDIIYMEKGYVEILCGRGTWYQKMGNVYRRFVVPRILKKSKRIITVSEFEKIRIASFFSMPEDGRLVAVSNGVGEHFKPVTDEAELKRIRDKYSLPDRFFFFLGNTDPKKNTPGTLEAYSRFVRRYGPGISLVMLDYNRDELRKLLAGIGAEDIERNILLTGYVTNADLPAIYSQCEIFLYPSLRESFGLPVLEAMACGVPVITSDTSSMPEVAGDAALLVNPADPGSITAAMLRLMSDPVLRLDLIEKGRLRAAMFSWKAMSLKVLNNYKEIFSEKK